MSDSFTTSRIGTVCRSVGVRLCCAVLLIVLAGPAATISAQADSARALLALADSLQKASAFDSTAVILERALAVAEESGADDTLIARILGNAGTVATVAGNYDRAERYCRRSLEVIERFGIPDTTAYARGLYRLSHILYRHKDYVTAESLLTLAEGYAEMVSPVKHVVLSAVIDLLAMIHMETGRPESAEWLYRRALAMRQEHLGERHPMTATSLTNLAMHLKEQSESDQAERLYLRALEIKQEVAGPNDISLIPNLNNLATLYNDRAEYSLAEDYLWRALRICRTHLPPDHPYAASVRNNLAASMSRQGKFVEAERLYLEAIDNIGAALSPEHPDIPFIMTSLADLYTLVGEYGKAEQTLHAALELLPDDDRSFAATGARTWRNLADCYRVQGKYAEADRLFSQSLALTEERLGEDHPSVAEVLVLYGNLKLDLGLVGEAEEQYRRAGRIYESAYSDAHPDYALALHNLGVLHLQARRHDRAQALFERALRINRAAAGLESPQSVMMLHSLGALCARRGDTTAADTLLAEALSRRLDLFGDGHRDVALTRLAFGSLRKLQGRYEEAEELLRRALDDLVASFGSFHPEVAMAEANLARLYATMERTTVAQEHFARSIAVRQRFLDYAFTFSSESQKLRWLDAYPMLDNALLSFAQHAQQPEITLAAAEMILRGKAVVADAVMAEREVVLCSDQPEIRAAFDRRTEVSTRIANLTLAGLFEDVAAGYRDTLTALTLRHDSLEASLSRQCAAFKLDMRIRDVHCPDIAESLEPGSALWEYVRYEPYDFDTIASEDDRVGPPRYLGLVVGPACEPTLVDLGEAAPIDSLVRHARGLIDRVGADILSPRAAFLEERLRAVLAELAERVFAPMAAVSPNDTVLFVSPDGALNLMPLQVLPLADGGYVVER
ncbi:tetratricopeptide repeat protein, partial [candidate division GN15 bacterium]|nr:tetratricopeptide repeat protein [candidate division GN15 bacterium]